MKNISLQVKIGILLFLAIVIVVSIGFISYRSMQAIVASITSGAKSDYTLISLKDISLELEKAENNIRLYSLSKSGKNLNHYYEALDAIDGMIVTLKANTNNSQLFSTLDTLNHLILEKQYIWNEMLMINKDDVLAERLKSLSDTLLRRDTLSRYIELNDTIVQIEKHEDLVNEEDTDEEPGFFQRLFGKKTITHDDEEVSPIHAEAEDEGSELAEAVRDTIDTVGLAAINRINPKEIADMISEVGIVDKQLTIRLRKEEIKLAETNSRLTEKFYLIMEELEHIQQKKIEQKAIMADGLARRTYLWLTFFCAAVSLLAVIVLFTVARYIRKSISYQKALEDSKKEAERLARAKEIFTANVSHEIRTPLNAIYGFLKQIDTESMGAENMEKIQVIQSSSENLLRIVNDVLDFSKLEAGKIIAEKVAFDLREILNEAYILFKNQALRNNSTLVIALSKSVSKVHVGDPYRLKQVIFNLLSNAIKFTQHGKITVHADQINLKGWRVELILTVSDTGIGIAPEKTAIIFEDYMQAEAGTTQRYGGTGLGLSIVKKILDLIGGSIRVESKLNAGSKFTCRIPLEVGKITQLKRTIDHKTRDHQEQLKHLRVLIADDEEYNRKLLKTLLKKWNMDYEEATNGLEAIEKLKTGTFALALLDIRMPALDGQKTARFVRESLKKTREQMPLIAITAAAGKAERERYIHEGFNEVICKPFDENELLNVMINLLVKQGKSKNPGMQITKKSTYTGTIDFEELMHISNNDMGFVKEMLEIFVASFRDGIKTFDKSLAEKDYHNIAETAHKIASPCRHLGAGELLKLAKEIETRSEDGQQSENISALINSLKTEFKTVEMQILNKLAEMR
jgi:signal transduction histidine kinase/CheY-like chemotaxis protein/HPt (histidine-containing phosphotransfer) domain-containing protein